MNIKGLICILFLPGLLYVIANDLHLLHHGVLRVVHANMTRLHAPATIQGNLVTSEVRKNGEKQRRREEMFSRGIKVFGTAKDVLPLDCRQPLMPTRPWWRRLEGLPIAIMNGLKEKKRASHARLPDGSLLSADRAVWQPIYDGSQDYFVSTSPLLLTRNTREARAAFRQEISAFFLACTCKYAPSTINLKRNNGQGKPPCSVPCHKSTLTLTEQYTTHTNTLTN